VDHVQDVSGLTFQGAQNALSVQDNSGLVFQGLQNTLEETFDKWENLQAGWQRTLVYLTAYNYCSDIPFLTLYFANSKIPVTEAAFAEIISESPDNPDGVKWRDRLSVYQVRYTRAVAFRCKLALLRRATSPDERNPDRVARAAALLGKVDWSADVEDSESGVSEFDDLDLNDPECVRQQLEIIHRDSPKTEKNIDSWTPVPNVAEAKVK